MIQVTILEEKKMSHYDAISQYKVRVNESERTWFLLKSSKLAVPGMVFDYLGNKFSRDIGVEQWFVPSLRHYLGLLDNPDDTETLNCWVHEMKVALKKALRENKVTKWGTQVLEYTLPTESKNHITIKFTASGSGLKYLDGITIYIQTPENLFEHEMHCEAREVFYNHYLRY